MSKNNDNFKAWWENNKEYHRAWNKEYYKSNKKKRLAQMNEYLSNNPDKRKEHQRTYRLKHKEKLTEKSRVYKAKRRANKLQRTPKWADLKAIAKFYEECPKGYHVDHIIPLKGKIVSGLHILENLQYLPALENIRKGNKFS